MGKNTDGERENGDENKLDFPDPDQEVQQQYFLIYRDDKNLVLNRYSDVNNVAWFFLHH